MLFRFYFFFKKGRTIADTLRTEQEMMLLPSEYITCLNKEVISGRYFNLSLKEAKVSGQRNQK